MRRRSVPGFVISCLALLSMAAVLAGSAARAEVYIDDSFETYADGGYPGGGWFPIYNAVNDPTNNTVTSGQHSDGTKSLQIYGSHSYNWTATFYYPMTIPSVFFVEFDFMNSGEIFASAGNPHEATAGLIDYFYGDWGGWTALLYSSKYGDVYGTGVHSGTGVIVPNFETMRWYAVKMLVNLPAGTVDYWVDGNYVGQQFNQWLIDKRSAYLYFELDCGGGKAWFDKVKVYSDSISPVTALSLSGTTGENDWYWSDVLVALSATDNDSGVARTEYSLDAGGTWNVYTGPLAVTNEGITVIDYRSIDNTGNVEPYLWDEVKIDRIAPVVVVSDTSPAPAHGATNVPASQTITVAFSENVQEGTNFANIKLYKGRIEPSKEVTNVYRHIEGGVLCIDPLSDLNPGTTYRVVIPAGSVKDMSGHPLAADFSPYSFDTVSVP